MEDAKPKPRARTKNKFIRTFSLSRECLTALGSMHKPWESKSATVERIILQRWQKEQEWASKRGNPSSPAYHHSTEQPAFEDYHVERGEWDQS